MAGQLGSLVVSLEANIARFTSDMGRAAQQTEQTMQRIDASTRQVERAMASMQRTSAVATTALVTMVGGMSAQKLIEYADGWTNVESRIKLVTTSSAELASVQGQLFDIANRNRTGIGETVALYTRLAQSSDTLGASQKEMIKFTEGVSAAVVLSGSGTAEAAGALQQLSQAMSNAKVQAQEYNSINDGAPEILRAVARNIQGVDGDLGKLRQRMLDGNLTSKDFFAAFMMDVDNLTSKSQGMQTTVAQSFTVLSNEAMKFVGESSKASGAGQALAGTVLGLANNLGYVSAAVSGLVAFKVSEWALTGAAALTTKAQAVMAERAATVASAQASLAAAEAEVVRLANKAEFIAAVRAETLATVARANAVIASAESDAASTLAMQSRTVAMTEMAAVGRAQIAITVAQTEASLALSAAQGAATRTGLAATAGAALMANPITAIVTVLGLGVAAWMAWGTAAENSERKAAAEVKKSTPEILSDLDKQIEKLRARNALAASGQKELAKQQTPASERAGEIQQKINDANAGVGDYSGQSEMTRQFAIMELSEELDKITVKTKIVATEQARYDESLNGKKLEAWLAKHDEYLSKADRLALKVKAAKDELGDAFTPAVEAKITAKFYEADTKAASAEGARLSKRVLDGQLRDLEEGLNAQLDELASANQYVEELRQQDLIDLDAYNDYRKRAIESAAAVAVKTYDAEIAAAERYRDSLGKGSEREAAQTKIDSLRAQRSQAEQEGKRQTAMETLRLSAAQSELNKQMQDWGRAQDASTAQQKFSNDLYGKTTVEVFRLTEAKRAELEVEEAIRRAKEKGAISPESIKKFRDEGKVKAQDATREGVRGSALGLMNSLKTPGEQEGTEHANRLAMLQAYREQDFADTIAANEAIRRESERHERAMFDMKLAGQQSIVGLMSDSSSQLYGMLKQAGMEQTALGKAAFLVSKGLAVAQIILSTNVAAAAALAPPPLGLGPVAGMGLAATIKGMGYASAGMTAGLAIAEASAEGGYDIPGGVNPVTQLHEKEMVLPKAQAEVIRGLATRGGAGGGGLSINYAPNFNVDSRTDRTAAMKDMQMVAQQANADLVDRLQRAGRIG